MNPKKFNQPAQLKREFLSKGISVSLAISMKHKCNKISTPMLNHVHV